MLLFAALGACLACDGGETIIPQDRVVATGVYAYEGRWLHPGSLEWDTVRGGLVIELATPDSVEGRWQIQGYNPGTVAGYWNENAFVVAAYSDDGQIRLTHRLWRVGSPAELSCSLAYREFVQLDTLNTSGTCDLVLAD